MKIALVVMESRCGEAEKNCDKICGYIEKAGREGVAFIVFPEAALTGYCLSHAKETALPSDHALAEKLRQTAKSFHVTAAVGMAERGSDAFWITQLVCGADGTLGVYRKTHLGSREKSVFSAGDALPVFHDPIPFGIGICYDMHFPEAAAAMRAHGATLIVSPHAAPVKAGQRSEVWMKYMPARAYDNRVFVACCNMCGNNGCGTEFSGGAAVYAPDGRMQDADFSGEEGMLISELSPMHFNEAGDFPLHRRPELYF